MKSLILFTLFFLSSCGHHVIVRNPASQNGVSCKEYSTEYLICKENNLCYFKEQNQYSGEEKETKVTCDYFYNNY